ncbi:hypothetical protein Btru_039947 [Bulinus truncatus]|nr:hypothetical protein Btru_039947 [Bulinus truncatus]
MERDLKTKDAVIKESNLEIASGESTSVGGSTLTRDKEVSVCSDLKQRDLPRWVVPICGTGAGIIILLSATAFLFFRLWSRNKAKELPIHEENTHSTFGEYSPTTLLLTRSKLYSMNGTDTESDLLASWSAHSVSAEPLTI